MIKILTGWSNEGGSTTAFINLTNEFNNRGIDCILYGPHDWHLDKCRSDKSENLIMNSDDNLIFHFVSLNNRPNVRKSILSCHETNVYEVSKVRKFWDEVVFVTKDQQSYHKDYNGSFRIIPNVMEKIVTEKKSELDKIAAIIGSIDPNKQTHVSIYRALKDKCDKILIFGKITDDNYFNTLVKPLLNDKIQYMGFVNNKNEIYDNVGRVYLSSKREVAPLVRDECLTTNTKFFGNDMTNGNTYNLNNDQIIDLWCNMLNI